MYVCTYVGLTCVLIMHEGEKCHQLPSAPEVVFCFALLFRTGLSTTSPAGVAIIEAPTHASILHLSCRVLKTMLKDHNLQEFDLDDGQS